MQYNLFQYKIYIFATTYNEMTQLYVLPYYISLSRCHMEVLPGSSTVYQGAC